MTATTKTGRPLPEYHPPTDPWLDILHEDDDIVVLNKQAGLLSVPGNISRDSLETRVADRFGDTLVAHRLDMATSGVIVMPRGKANLANIGKQFENRQTHKRYIAMVWGQLSSDAGTIDAPMRCDWPNRPIQMICHERGRPALTHWQVTDRFDDRTRVALTPITGRSHQLRLHLKSIGHSILGDEWYADGPARAAADRLLLHAEALTLRHPGSGEMMTFIAPVPF
ncbi:pseudouridine synthase [Parvularcula sp. LCG005]|uniref:pseudouridine synthase n=1 Tax=Parvularcula sp. LCG005 TaxID=3078805 RepID=UPI002941DF8B|nr:pseudouridine synthase [Parvularcula sp. LCG005]WOI52441.1 pseudouridine synthase [Parvularcula sp. LCG005]